MIPILSSLSVICPNNDGLSVSSRYASATVRSPPLPLHAAVRMPLAATVGSVRDGPASYDHSHRGLAGQESRTLIVLRNQSKAFSSERGRSDSFRIETSGTSFIVGRCVTG